MKHHIEEPTIRGQPLCTRSKRILIPRFWLRPFLDWVHGAGNMITCKKCLRAAGQRFPEQFDAHLRATIERAKR